MADKGQWCVRFYYLEANVYNVAIQFISAERLENHKKFNKSERNLLRDEDIKYFDTFEEALEAFKKLAKGKEED